MEKLKLHLKFAIIFNVMFPIFAAVITARIPAMQNNIKLCENTYYNELIAWYVNFTIVMTIMEYIPTIRKIRKLKRNENNNSN